jgi:histidyl-tRNA synthetase
MQAKALPGFRDFYPEDLALRTYIFATWRAVAARYGFEEYDGPPLESLELYTQKSGDEIVAQLYAFTDKGDRPVALRPEMTPTLARMVGARAQALKKPIRWFSIPQLFRYERQQRGRLREHFQLNVDVLGDPSPAADAEVIAVAIDVMRAFGLGPAQVRVRVSDRRVLAAALVQLGVRDGELGGVLAALDKAERSREYTLELLGNALGGDRARVAAVAAFADRLGDAAADLCALPAAGPLNDCLTRLDAMGLSGFTDVDFRVVRGLAYYTGIVFELFDAGRTLRAICGGGRYDDLVKQVAGVDLPCVGFGMGDVVLGELLRDGALERAAPRRLDAFLVAVSGDDERAVLGLAHELRDRGLAIEYALRPGSVRKQLELAAARGALCAVILGPEERAAGTAVVRDLTAGTETRVAFADVREGRFG